MARISGINLPKDKRIEVALTYIYGISRSSSRKILNSAAVSLNVKVKDLSEEDISKLRNFIEKIQTEGDLRRMVDQNIRRLQDIGAYRGYRHRRRLPARGQRTRTNARTKRGKRVTVGSGKRKEQKT